MRSCLERIGLGLGRAAGAGLAYVLVIDQTARVAAGTLLIFILGAVVAGTFIVLAIYAQGRALSPHNQRTTIQYPAALPPAVQGPAWPGMEPGYGYPQLAPPQQQWSHLPHETVDQDTDRFVA